jgi:putative ABC transport system ATP-binding protein
MDTTTTNMDESFLFRLENISKIYITGEVELHALDSISLDIYKGEFLVVSGPSGSGKSTLLNILGGTDRPSKGSIWFENQDLSKFSDRQLTLYRRNEIGFVFQFFNLIPTLTALENIEVATSIAQNPLNPLETLDLVGLKKLARHFPAQMSGGEQQRIAIARALASNPHILFCDEPTGSLDSQASKKILALLVQLCKEMHKNVMLITHNPNLTRLGHRVIYLKDGKVDQIVHIDNPVSVDDLP